MDAKRREQLRTTWLRGLVIVALVLAIVAAALAFVPSIEVYEDSRNCVGRAVVRLFTFEHGTGGPRCDPSWVLAATRTAERHPAEMLLYFAAVMAPALLVWRRARLWDAVLWSLWTVVATVAMFALTFDLGLDHLFQRVVHLTLAHLYTATSIALVGGLIVVVPLGCLVFAIATRQRPMTPPELPRARALRANRE